MINVNYLLKYDCTVCGGGSRADGRGRCSPCVSVCPCVRSICTVCASVLVLRFRLSFRLQASAWRCVASLIVDRLLVLLLVLLLVPICADCCCPSLSSSDKSRPASRCFACCLVALFTAYLVCHNVSIHQPILRTGTSISGSRFTADPRFTSFAILSRLSIWV